MTVITPVLEALWNDYVLAVHTYRAEPTDKNAKTAWAHYDAFMDAYEGKEQKQ